MAAPIRTPRDRWIDAGMRALGEGGPAAVRVEVLAKALGVTKGGFYGHFTGREQLLHEVLDAWERASTHDVVARVEGEGGGPGARMRRAGLLTFSDDLAPVDLAVRDWARRDPAVAARLRRVDEGRMAYLRLQFGAIFRDEDEVEARAMLAFSLLVGHHQTTVGHGVRSREQVLERAARILET